MSLLDVLFYNPCIIAILSYIYSDRFIGSIKSKYHTIHKIKHFNSLNVGLLYMDKNDESTFKLNPGSMLNLFLESNLLEQIKQIQKNENLKDESEVVIRAIQYYYEKNISGESLESEGINNKGKFFPQSLSAKQYDDVVQRSFTKLQNEVKELRGLFDGNVDIGQLEKILAGKKFFNLVKKLPQHQIYNNIHSAGMIYRFQTKILPVKFSLMCLAKLMIEQDRPWIDLNEFKNYTLDSAKLFIKTFDSSSIRTKFKVKTGFPISKPSMISNFDQDQYLSYIRSSKRFTEDFVGRKLKKRLDVQMGGACFEMGLIKAKTIVTNEKDPARLRITLSDNGKEFVSYKNDLIDFIYGNNQDIPESIFSQQETEFYFRKILPEFKFENDFVEYLMEHKQIMHTREIKNWFEEKFDNFCKSNFPEEEYYNEGTLQEHIVRIYSNTIMGRLMEFGVFTKDPKSRSGPYIRRKNLSDLR